MQFPKLKVLIEAGVVRDVAAIYQPDPVGWTVQVTHSNRTGERREALERQRCELSAEWSHFDFGVKAPLGFRRKGASGLSP